MGLIWITNANYLKDYKIELEFNNNKKGVFDFENHLHTKLFLPLKELETFKKFKLNSWTLEWENGADFSPEFLLENLKM
ncbi:MAG: DUF2442 domain-containing protein [Flavobacterium sp.]|jgi:hypothetical protein|nr:DUF2442 domain-containing protein [Flavobacterium sp.]